MNKLKFTVELDGSDLFKVNNNNADAFERKADRLLMTPAFYSIVRDSLKEALETLNNVSDTTTTKTTKKPCTCKKTGNKRTCSKACNNKCTKTTTENEEQ